ncbi:MAG: TonB-dependent receptor [Polaribacter sp.]|jgi:outer membrane receptor protein involved in Fe transport|nr:TonB-dependent receptor [Polaribacter sp.]
MKKHLQVRFTVLILMLLSTTVFFAQSTITGVVRDTNNQAIPGVNIILKGTTLGTTSDFDGKYSIADVPNGEYTLIASYIGYDNFKKQISLNSKNTVIDIIIKENAESLDEIVVTGVVNPKSKIESSISVSTVNIKQIEQATPRSAGELFRIIPGIRAESSGGEGNANFNVRGVPVSSGGSRYLQLQEDGLPIMLFGDTSFGNADNFLRIDSNIGRVEAIRGGSASTQTSNGPAGIINMISKTGNVEGGSIGATYGLDFQTSRLDFEYGTKISDNLYYHIGGFMRVGEGPREIGYQGNKGGQIKANITKEFNNGYVRTYFKFLNDRSVMYMPMPVSLTGTNTNPTFGNLPGFDITTDTPHSVNIQNTYSVYDGNPTQNDMRNGNNPVSKAIGAEFSFDLGDGWDVNGKARYSNNSGQWNAPFTANVGTVSDIEALVRGASGATGALTFQDGTPFNPANGLAQDIRYFDVTIEDLSNFFSDVKVTKAINNNIGLTVGMFSATQNTKIGWQWSSAITEVAGDGKARLGVFEGFSQGGAYSFGQPVWGNCCQRKYNTVHNVNSPYVGVDAEISEKLNFDGSIRFENVNVNGTINSGQLSNLDSNGNLIGFDYNSDGVISPFEQTIPTIAGNPGQAISDNYNFVSFSAGLNYKINDGAAVFGRFSKGASGRAADRNNYGADGLGDVQFDEISQFEIGLKKRLNNGVLNVTGFISNTDEGISNELNRTVGNPFKAMGLEVESAYRFGDFGINGSVTYTKAEIDGGANKGNAPRRQADFIYSLAPTYSFGSNKQHLLGLTILGTSKSFAQDDNVLVMPGYAYINAIARVGLTKGLSLSVNANNLFDTIGVTEVEGNGNIAGGLAAARTISGRSTTMTLQYSF